MGTAGPVAESTAPRPVTSFRPWAVTGVVAVSWFVIFGGRLVLPASAVQIQESVGIGNAGFGLAVSVLWGGYSAMQFPSGVIADDIGYRVVLVVPSLFMGVGFAALAGVTTFPGFVLVAGLIGIGTGLLTTPTLSLVSLLHGEQKGRALGVVNAAGDASGVVAPIAATAVLLVATWHFTFLVLGAVSGLLAVAFHLVLSDRYSIGRPAIIENVRASGREMIKTGVPGLLLIYSVYAFVWQGLSTFIPLYVSQTKELPQAEANGMLALFFLAGTVVKPLAGWLSDVLSRGSIASGSLLASGVTLLALATVAEGRLAVFVTVAAFGTALMAFPPVMQSYLMDLFEGDQMGGAFGLSRTIFILVGSAGPGVIGYASEVASFDATFIAMSGGLVVSAVGLLVITRFLGGN
jgi:sugar phosphate permease